jgi:hypothetical protein
MALGSIEGTMWGCIGGFGGYFFGYLRLTQERPDKVAKWFFKKEVLILSLFLAIIHAFVGGLACFAYIQSNHSFDIWLALNIGASAPLLFANVAAKTPAIDPAENIKNDDP